jgi:acyl carrier protein phosphodiesterase
LNWLAHVFLSEPSIEQRLGNLLADVVRGEERVAMSEGFRRGARRHHAIDVFTDAHPIVRRSRLRLGATHRRFSPVLVDVFYDYFLASRWERYAEGSLDAFTNRFYVEAEMHRRSLPQHARELLDRIIQLDLLGAYRTVEGVEQSLRRLSAGLSARWRRDFALQAATAELRAHEAALAQDFAEFFPALQAHLQRAFDDAAVSG